MFSYKKIRLKMVFDCVSLLQHQSRNKSSFGGKRSFDEALKSLNSLQTNLSVLQESIAKKNPSDVIHVVETKKYLQRVGVELSDIRSLPIIHVAGTKGKGSTSAFTESILRSVGLRTGFFSSPHLVSVTERIRLNGASISKTKFASYFWEIYTLLNDNKDDESDMPAYFKFLTVMAYYVFLKEKIDVAIFEVGIGGQYDPTNIHPQTGTVGITSLGLEHTKLLGETLEEIAWQKAGIIKPKSNVFTVEQPNECVNVIRDRVLENRASLYAVPNFDSYPWPRPVKLSINHDIQKLNASLAIQLACNWMKLNYSSLPKSVATKVKFLETQPVGITLKISDDIIYGLENCIWPGRCQFLEIENLKFYLDGAHTIESINICIDWFEQQTCNSLNPKCLIFNLTGDREFLSMSKILHSRLQYDCVFFVPNVPFLRNYAQDNSNFVNGLKSEEQIQKCIERREMWTDMSKETRLVIKQGGKGQVGRVRNDRALAMSSISEAVENIRAVFPNEDVEILVTGSLHLIGATLIVLDELQTVVNR